MTFEHTTFRSVFRNANRCATAAGVSVSFSVSEIVITGITTDEKDRAVACSTETVGFGF